MAQIDETSNFAEIVTLNKMYPTFYRRFFNSVSLWGEVFLGTSATRDDVITPAMAKVGCKTGLGACYAWIGRQQEHWLTNQVLFVLLTLLSLLTVLQQTVDLLHHCCDVKAHRFVEESVCAQARGFILWCLIAKFQRPLLAWNVFKLQFFQLFLWICVREDHFHNTLFASARHCDLVNEFLRALFF